MRRAGWVVLAIVFAAFIVAALTVAAGGGAEESAARGKLYAQAACASCHAIAAERRSPSPGAPAFAAIADMPGMNRRALNAFLHTPHRTMPNLVIDPRRIDDLSAYIATLKTRGAL